MKTGSVDLESRLEWKNNIFVYTGLENMDIFFVE